MLPRTRHEHTGVAFRPPALPVGWEHEILTRGVKSAPNLLYLAERPRVGRCNILIEPGEGIAPTQRRSLIGQAIVAKASTSRPPRKTVAHEASATGTLDGTEKLFPQVLLIGRDTDGVGRVSAAYVIPVSATLQVVVSFEAVPSEGGLIVPSLDAVRVPGPEELSGPLAEFVTIAGDLFRGMEFYSPGA